MYLLSVHKPHWISRIDTSATWPWCTWLLPITRPSFSHSRFSASMIRRSLAQCTILRLNPNLCSDRKNPPNTQGIYSLYFPHLSLTCRINQLCAVLCLDLVFLSHELTCIFSCRFWVIVAAWGYGAVTMITQSTSHPASDALTIYLTSSFLSVILQCRIYALYDRSGRVVVVTGLCFTGEVVITAWITIINQIGLRGTLDSLSILCPRRSPLHFHWRISCLTTLRISHTGTCWQHSLLGDQHSSLLLCLLGTHLCIWVSSVWPRGRHLLQAYHQDEGIESGEQGIVEKCIGAGQCHLLCSVCHNLTCGCLSIQTESLCILTEYCSCIQQT